MSASIVQTALERAKHLTYTELQKTQGECRLPVNNESDLAQLFGQSNCLLLDRSANFWSDAAIKGAFKGEVVQKVEPGLSQDSLRVTITCQWSDAGRAHKYAASTTINKQGLQQ